MVENAVSEQEAFGIEALAHCVNKLLPQDFPWFEERAFGNEDSKKYGMYNPQGGNYCNYMAGLLQQYLPGVAASIYNAVEMAYYNADWASMGFPPPEDLGIRTAEYLRYKSSGLLGPHTDGGSVFSISIALSNMEDYTGGFFQLKTADSLFKVARRSAIVFFSETDHSITEITGGERKVFVIELWENQDTPVGLARPTEETFAKYKDERHEFLPPEFRGEEGEEEEEDSAGDEL